jgi:glycerate-2-kinase
MAGEALVEEREDRAEIVQSGVWLYDNSVPTDVWIVKQNFEYWYEAGYAAAAEELNDDGEAFQVVFARDERRIIGPSRLSQEAAVSAAEEQVRAKIDWTNHIRQKLFGGRWYSITAVE